MLKLLKTTSVLILISLMCLGICVPDINADAAPIQFLGNGIITHDPKGVVLKRENLSLKVNEEFCEFNGWTIPCGEFDVEAIFYLESPEDNLELDTFFPIPGSYGVEAGNVEFGVVSEIVESFTMTLNKSRVETKAGEIEYEEEFPSMEPSTALYATLNLRKGENELVVKYNNPLTSSYEGGYTHIYYVLKSGALWADSIGELNIRIEFADEMPITRYSSVYPYTHENKNTLVYDVTNIEPTEDIAVDFVPADIWEKIQPFIRGEDGNLSLQEREEIEKFLLERMGNKELLRSSEDDILHQIYESNLEYLIRNGTTNKGIKRRYFDYHASRLRDLAYEYGEGGCAEFEEDLLENEKQKLLDKVEKYSLLDESEKKAEVEVVEGMKCESYDSYEETSAEDDSQDSESQEQEKCEVLRIPYCPSIGDGEKSEGATVSLYLFYALICVFGLSLLCNIVGLVFIVIKVLRKGKPIVFKIGKREVKI